MFFFNIKKEYLNFIDKAVKYNILYILGKDNKIF